ncbi:MAG TPA: DUF1761 domain-containing protein [Gammaproteobacteria bacterium]|jgi:hypothetical protein|nr:DUF1761 domain-containing protein [Gammaproteobacteria bacterium]
MLEMLQGINYLIVLVAAVSSWVLGWLWYSKWLFGGIWVAENGSSMGGGKRHPAVTHGLAFVFWFITATAFSSAVGGGAPFGFATMIGFLTGSCFVATSFGVNYAYAGRSGKLFLIDAGYTILQFTIYGMIFGYWH